MDIQRIVVIVLVSLMMLSNLSVRNALCMSTRSCRRTTVEGRIRRISVLEGRNHGKATFELTPDEETLFQSLRQFVAENKMQTTIRVAGGWVRDKLLSLQGKNDIDMTIDSMTGSQFMKKYNEWRGDERHKYTIVKKNPDKSKHLETGLQKMYLLQLLINEILFDLFSCSHLQVREFGT